jgi:hypothetical protein
VDKANFCVVLVLLNHWAWFQHFSSTLPPPSRNFYDKPIPGPNFTEIASYFGICVWMVPFSLFVSLSAGDNVLPTMGSETPGGTPRNKRQGMVKVLVDNIRESIGEVAKLTPWFKPRDRGF